MVHNEVIDLSNNGSLLRSSFLRMSRNFGGTCDIPKTAVKGDYQRYFIVQFNCSVARFRLHCWCVRPTQLAKMFCGSVFEASYLCYEGITFSLPDSEVRPSHLSYHLSFPSVYYIPVKTNGRYTPIANKLSLIISCRFQS